MGRKELYGLVNMACHVVDSFSIPDPESMSMNLLLVVRQGFGERKRYFGFSSPFFRELPRQVFIEERKRMSVYAIARKYNVSSREVYRTLKGVES